MITRKEITDKTGLSRWQVQKLATMGIVSRGETRTHPHAPRGRATCHPKSDLAVCEEIARLMKEGFSLRDAAQRYAMPGVKKLLEEYEKMPSFAEVFKDVMVSQADGEESNLMDFFYSEIRDDLNRITEDQEVHDKIISKFEERDALEYVVNTALLGYSPVALWNGVDLIIAPDFLLSSLFIFEQNDKPHLVIPLLRILNMVFKIYTKDSQFRFEPSVSTASKVLAKEGNRLVEYEVVPHGYLGVELVERTAKVVGKIKK